MRFFYFDFTKYFYNLTINLIQDNFQFTFLSYFKPRKNDYNDLMEPIRKPKFSTTFSWIIYDLANTIFSMNVVTRYFAAWLVIDLALDDYYYSLSYSLSMLIVALTMPVVGAISDRYRRRMPLLISYTLVCVIFTALIGVAGQAISDKAVKITWALIFFVIANYSYQGGLVFYNALLPDISSERSMGRVSGYGVAFGYIGSIIGLILVTPFVEGKIWGKEISFISAGGTVASFIPTAILFLIFALPTFIFVKDPKVEKSIDHHRLEIKATFKKVLDGISNTKKYPGVLRFLIAKFFYEDAIQTVILFMAVYTQKVMGFSSENTTNFFIMIIPSVVIGSALFGTLTDHYGPKKVLIFVLIGWIISLTVLVLTMKIWLFWILGAFIGIFMGSTWTSARPLLIALVPRDMLGEFFGLYSFSGKLAAIFGPLVWAAMVAIFSDAGDVIKYKAAILALNILIIIGLFILLKVPDARKAS